MKYIDSEKLIAEIERLYDEHSSKYEIDEAAIVLDKLEDFVTSLQQEQPEGVPLTEEILQKNFPTPEEIIWWPLDDGSFRVEMQDDTHLIIGKYNYVHELQHALRLFGKNGEIKL